MVVTKTGKPRRQGKQFAPKAVQYLFHFRLRQLIAPGLLLAAVSAKCWAAGRPKRMNQLNAKTWHNWNKQWISVLFSPHFFRRFP